MKSELVSHSTKKIHRSRRSGTGDMLYSAFSWANRGLKMKWADFLLISLLSVLTFLLRKCLHTTNYSPKSKALVE